MTSKFSFINGFVCAPVVPLNADGTVNLHAIEPYADLLVRNGIEGVFVNGTTGEGLSLTVEERKAIAAKWVDVSSSKLKIIVHGGSTCLVDSQAIAKHAADIGAWGFATIGSIWFRTAGPEGLAAYLADIAQVIPNMPFYYYHIPSLTGIDMPMLNLLPHAAKIPNFHGIKYTFETLMDFEACRRYENGRFNMLYGRDEMFLSAMGFGCTGAVGSTYNTFVPVYQDMIKAFNAGKMDEARRLQYISHDLIYAMIRTGNFFTALKVMLSELGVPCGAVRGPLKQPPKEKFDHFLAEIKSIGFDKYKMK
jgi:N-acetylneuraminate lyase